jgi:hypothetical protein
LELPGGLRGISRAVLTIQTCASGCLSWRPRDESLNETLITSMVQAWAVLAAWR